MQLRIFNIPIGADESIVEEMNYFLRANKIIDIRKELATLNGNSCWSFCITYLQPNRNVEFRESKQSNGKTDYKELLEPDAFDRFALFRKCRKEIADGEAIPAYAVFTDAELAELAKLTELTLAEMLKIPGVGKKKAEKYGNLFVSYLARQTDEKSGKPDGADCES